MWPGLKQLNIDKVAQVKKGLEKVLNQYLLNACRPLADPALMEELSIDYPILQVRQILL